MTPSKELSIISRVNWIHQNRAKLKELELEKEAIEKKISELASETIDKIDLLKKDMKNIAELNIKIEGNYYTLTQNSQGVEIKQFHIQIEE